MRTCLLFPDVDLLLDSLVRLATDCQDTTFAVGLFDLCQAYPESLDLSLTHHRMLIQASELDYSTDPCLRPGVLAMATVGMEKGLYPRPVQYRCGDVIHHIRLWICMTQFEMQLTIQQYLDHMFEVLIEKGFQDNPDCFLSNLDIKIQLQKSPAGQAVIQKAYPLITEGLHESCIAASRAIYNILEKSLTFPDFDSCDIQSDIVQAYMKKQLQKYERQPWDGSYWPLPGWKRKNASPRVNLSYTKYKGVRSKKRSRVTSVSSPSMPGRETDSGSKSTNKNSGYHGKRNAPQTAPASQTAATPQTAAAPSNEYASAKKPLLKKKRLRKLLRAEMADTRDRCDQTFHDIVLNDEAEYKPRHGQTHNATTSLLKDTPKKLTLLTEQNGKKRDLSNDTDLGDNNNTAADYGEQAKKRRCVECSRVSDTAVSQPATVTMTAGSISTNGKSQREKLSYSTD